MAGFEWKGEEVTQQFEYAIAEFSKQRAKGNLQQNLLGEQLRLLVLPDGSRCFIDFISREENQDRNTKDRWAMSARDKLTKDYLYDLIFQGEAPRRTNLLLVLTEHDGTPRYLVQYAPSIVTYQTYPEPFWLIEAGFLHRSGSCTDCIHAFGTGV